MSRLKQRVRRINRSVSQQLSEPIQFIPIKKSEYNAAGIDPERAGLIVMGHLRLNGDEVDTGGVGNKTWNSRVAISMPVLTIAREDWPQGLLIQEGDQFVALDRDGLKFEVCRTDRNEIARIKVILSEIL